MTARSTSSQRLSMLSAKLWLLLAALEVARAPFEHAPLDGIVKHPDVKIGKGHGKGHGKKQKLEGPGSDEDAAVESPSAIFHKRKVALVTGITGQDGSYLAELLLAKGCACFALHSSLRMRFIFILTFSHLFSDTVHGIVRRTSSFNTKRITGLNTQNLYLHYGDLTDATSCLQIVTDVQPSEVYNLGAQYCTTQRLE